MSLKELEDKLKALSIEKNTNTLDISKEIGNIDVSVNEESPFDLDLAIIAGNKKRY